LRSLRHKITFVPAGHTYRDWQRPLFWKSHINPIPMIVSAGMLGWMRLI
jgi:hypothetical protein